MVSAGWIHKALQRFGRIHGNNREESGHPRGRTRTNRQDVRCYCLDHLQCLDIIYGDNGKSSGLPRGMPLYTRMAELQANMRGIQWHPRVQNPVRKRAPYLRRRGCSLCTDKTRSQRRSQQHTRLHTRCSRLPNCPGTGSCSRVRRWGGVWGWVWV
jgi:hypothetical protein